MSYMSKSVAAVVGLLVMAIVFSRQLFLFTIKEPAAVLDPHGGSYHLWLSLLAGLFACIAGALMFHFFGRHSSELSQTESATRVPTNAPLAVPAASLPASIPFDNKHWVQLNPWLSEGQRDDRTPADGSLAESLGTPSGQRSFARDSHQLNFKKWSQARRD